MIRNSTNKYKLKYEKSIEKGSHNSLLHTPTSKTSIISFQHSLKSMPTMNRSSSSKKVEGFNQTKHKTKDIPNFFFQQKLTLVKMGRNFKNNNLQQNILNTEKGYNSVTLTMRENKKIKQKEIKYPFRNSEDFIQNLVKNTLFYCTHCYQYVFDIEKKRHYPQCKDEVTLADRKSETFSAFALKKLQGIVELARYTKTKETQIQKLYSCYTKSQLQKMETVDYPKNYQFFKLQEIQMAYAHCYDKLLAGVPYRMESGLFTCF